VRRGAGPGVARARLAPGARRARRERPARLATLMVLATLAPAGLGAQQAPQAGQGAPRPLSLEEAVALALEHNPSYQRQLNQVAVAEVGERQRLGALLPSLSAGLSLNGNTSRVKTTEDPWGRPISEAQYIESTRSTMSQALSGSVPLFNLQTLRQQGEARGRTEVQAAAAVAGAALLRTQVGGDYYDAVLQEGLVGVEERSLATARETLGAIRQLLRIAARQPTDVLGAELQVAQAEQAVQQARGGARKARLQLASRMGVSLDTEYELVSGFPRVFDPAALELDGLMGRALGANPRLAQQAAQVGAAERSLAVARAARYPSLNGSYSWGRSTSLPDYDAFREFSPPNQSWGFGLSLSFPLLNRFQTWGGVGQAQLEAESALESLREARLDLEREVRSALIDLENAYTSVQLAERAAEIAVEQLRQGQEQYRLNTLDYTALQRMVDQVAASERSVLRAYSSFALALLALEERVGGPVGVPAGAGGGADAGEAGG
jgi:outer membrane protein